MINTLLRGLGDARPWLVGLARGILEAAVMAGLAGLYLTLTSSPPQALVPFLPVVLFGLRLLEGIADSIDPAKQRAPTDGGGGGGAQ